LVRVVRECLQPSFVPVFRPGTALTCVVSATS
jgi:hypothetical protein